MPELSANLITARLVTLVAELLLLGLALLLVLAEYRRARRHHLRPLLVALTLLVIVVGVTGVLGTVEQQQWILYSPFVADLLGWLQVVMLCSLLTHYFQLVDPEGSPRSHDLVRVGLYAGAGLALAIGIYYQLPMVYGIPQGARTSHVLFDCLLVGLTVPATRRLWKEFHPLHRHMAGSVAAIGLWALTDLLFWQTPGLILLTEALAVVALVGMAVIQVTAELTSIAVELHHTSASLEHASRGLRQLQTTAATLLRTGSVKACLTTVLDVLSLQLGLRHSAIFLLNPTTGAWDCYRMSSLTGQAVKSGEMPLERRQFLTELILSGQSISTAAAPNRVDQDFLNLTGFSKHLAFIPLTAPRVSYTPLGDNERSPMQRGSAWKSEPCWLADRICMLGLGNFPQRLQTCKTCSAFEPLGVIVTDLRHITEETRPGLEVLESLGSQASLVLRDLMQLEELVTDIRFRTAALDPLPLGIVLLGPDGRITAINRAVRQLAGPKASTWLGRSLGEVPLTIEPQRLKTLIDQMLRAPQEEPVEFAVDVVGPQGLRQCQLRFQALLRNHVLTGILLTVEDRTETLDLQRTVMQQERFAAMGQLAMGIAHEVNNPIAGVSGLLQMLAKRLPPEAAEQRPIQTALGDLRRASETIRNLLQFARPRPAQPKPVDLNALATEVVDLQSFHHLAAEVRFERDLTPATIWAQTDKESLAQVLTNLLLNALQAMGGSGTITIGTYETPQRLLLTIADTGPGIAPDILPRIFEPFFTTKKSGQGTGLGLSLCEMLLGGLGGSMAVVSGSTGTEFILTLPKARRMGALTEGADVIPEPIAGTLPAAE